VVSDVHAHIDSVSDGHNTSEVQDQSAEEHAEIQNIIVAVVTILTE
jgi:hypothetical protein